MKDTKIFIDEHTLEYKVFRRCSEGFIYYITDGHNVSLLGDDEVDMIINTKTGFGTYYQFYIDDTQAGWMHCVEGVMEFSDVSNLYSMRLWCESMSLYSFVTSYDNITPKGVGDILVFEIRNELLPAAILTTGIPIKVNVSDSMISIYTETEEDALQLRLLL